MNIKEMIEVLQAARRGEKIEMSLICDFGDRWVVSAAPQWNFRDFDYRIAPKREMTLVEELRHYGGIDSIDLWGRLCRNAADRITELEQYGLQDYTTDELLAELKRRTG